MKKKLRSRFRSWFQEGFWFFRFQKFIGHLNRKCSIGNRFKWWLAEEGEAPPGAAEFYQAAITLIGLIWFMYLPSIPSQVYNHNLYKFFGGVISGYFILELFVFSLDWIFVAKPPLESHRRSLGTYILSLIQITLFFSIFFSHTNCIEPYQPSFGLIIENIKSFISLQSMEVPDSGLCQVASNFRLLTGVTFMAIIFASLVGVIVRPEKET
ncbi:MAG: hypothetical protein ACW97O_11630 [Candidatus Thorarchaeota archaeon]|jgi:hypothetical protein